MEVPRIRRFFRRLVDPETGYVEFAEGKGNPAETESAVITKMIRVVYYYLLHRSENSAVVFRESFIDLMKEEPEFWK